jgi:hypothetical protein
MRPGGDVSVSMPSGHCFIKHAGQLDKANLLPIAYCSSLVRSIASSHDAQAAEDQGLPREDAAHIRPAVREGAALGSPGGGGKLAEALLAMPGPVVWVSWDS